MPAITTKSEHTGRWTKMHRRFVPFSGSGTSRHTRSSVGFITITYGFRFSVQTTLRISVAEGGDLSVRSRRLLERSLVILASRLSRHDDYGYRALSLSAPSRRHRHAGQACVS